jgi:hypothetical protein
MLHGGCRGSVEALEDGHTGYRLKCMKCGEQVTISPQTVLDDIFRSVVIRQNYWKGGDTTVFPWTWELVMATIQIADELKP